MRDPLPKNNNFRSAAYSHYSGGGFTAPPKNHVGNNNSNHMQVRKDKSDYCWNFNKGVRCKFGARCKFIERCKYCDSPSHGVNACQKLLKKENNHSQMKPNSSSAAASAGQSQNSSN